MTQRWISSRDFLTLIFILLLDISLLQFHNSVSIVSASPAKSEDGNRIFVRKESIDFNGSKNKIEETIGLSTSPTENISEDEETSTERAAFHPSVWTPIILCLLFILVWAIVAIPALMALKQREKLNAAKAVLAQVAERTRRFTLTLSPEAKSGFSRMSSQSSSMSA